MKLEKIRAKQFFKIVIVYIIANDLIRGIYGHNLKNDVWIPNLIGTLISVLLFTLYMFIYKNNKFDNFDNSMKHTLGKIFSKVLYVFYIIYFLLLIFLNLIDIVEAVSLYLLPSYRESIISIIILITVAYVVLKKMEVIARLSELIFYGIVIIFIFMIVLSLSVHDMQIDHTLPILKDGIKVIVRPSLEMGYSVPYGELFVLLVIFQHLESNEKYTKVGNYSILTASFILTTITLFNIIFVGPFAMSYGLSPAFRLARLIDVEEYVQRLDLLLIGFHMIVVVLKLAILLYGAGHLVQNIFKFKKDKPLNITYIVMIIIIFFARQLMSKSYTDILLFRKDFLAKYIGLIFEVFFPLLIVILSFIRKNKRKVDPKDLLEFAI